MNLNTRSNGVNEVRLPLRKNQYPKQIFAVCHSFFELGLGGGLMFQAGLPGDTAKIILLP